MRRRSRKTSRVMAEASCSVLLLGSSNKNKLQVYEAEQEIAARSKKAESKWCTDKWQTSSQGKCLNRSIIVSMLL